MQDGAFRVRLLVPRPAGSGRDGHTKKAQSAAGVDDIPGTNLEVTLRLGRFAPVDMSPREESVQNVCLRRRRTEALATIRRV